MKKKKLEKCETYFCVRNLFSKYDRAATREKVAKIFK